MTMSSTSRGLILVGVSAMVAVALSWAVTAGHTSSITAISHTPDTTTVERLTVSADRTRLERIQTTPVVSSTAWLAAGLLLNPIYYEIDLPLIER
jgi:hypothetical protein